MQIANILSDLTSLRVCDHIAALALVSARAPSSSSQSHSPQSQRALPQVFKEQESATKEEPAWRNNDPDMQRATDLVELHYGVKVKYAGGLDRELVEARREVEGVMDRLRLGERGQGRGR